MCCRDAPEADATDESSHASQARSSRTGSHSGDSRSMPRLQGTRARKPAPSLKRNPQFPNLPTTVPLTYTLTMQACLSERRSERPSFAQITTILADLSTEVARGNYINSLGHIQVRYSATVRVSCREWHRNQAIHVHGPPVLQLQWRFAGKLVALHSVILFCDPFSSVAWVASNSVIVRC